MGEKSKKSRKHPALIADNADISVTFYAAFCLQQVAWKSPCCSLGDWWLASISAAVSLPQTRCLHHEAIWPSICVQWKLQRSTSEVSGGPGRSDLLFPSPPPHSFPSGHSSGPPHLHLLLPDRSAHHYARRQVIDLDLFVVRTSLREHSWPKAVQQVWRYSGAVWCRYGRFLEFTLK